MNINLLLIISAIFILITGCSLPQRTGDQIYTALFGKPDENCVTVLESRDAVALDDGMIFLHFKPCKKEIKRLLAQSPYVLKQMSKMKIDLTDTDEKQFPEWWDIKKLGNICITFEYFHTGEDRAQIGYMSMDSSEVFYKDLVW